LFAANARLAFAIALAQLRGFFAFATRRILVADGLAKG
jgi:hypothetical protein